MNSCMMCVCVCLLPISHKMLVSKCDRWTPSEATVRGEHFGDHKIKGGFPMLFMAPEP